MILSKRYFSLALVAVTVELLVLYLLRSPLKDVVRIPRDYQQIVSGNNIFSSSFLPTLFSERNPGPALLNHREGGNTYTSSLEGAAEKKFATMGLVNISARDSSIVVNLKYSTEDNFLHKNLYGELSNCYLQKDVAEKLVRAQRILKKKFPFYSLIIYDAVRPVSIQKIMWDELQVPEKEKWKYVSDPSVGSLHNYGCAADVSIVNENGWEMDMGTSYDYFGELGYPIAEKRMLENGKLTWRQYENRKLLREVMSEAGFTGISTEWWHFNGTSLKQAKEKYQLID